MLNLKVNLFFNEDGKEFEELFFRGLEDFILDKVSL